MALAGVELGYSTASNALSETGDQGIGGFQGSTITLAGNSSGSASGLIVVSVVVVGGVLLWKLFRKKSR